MDIEGLEKISRKAELSKNEKLKIMIITVAGASGRFIQSLGYPCLKCLYYENSIEESLLYRLLHQEGEFDCYVIVGGFQYERLETVVSEELKEFGDKILLIKNEHFADLGSGYSLYLALDKIKNMEFEQVVFAEGDLYVDRESFRKVYDSPGNVVTCNREPILSEKAVAFYFDENDGIHYIYDTAHSALMIKEPFLGIFNSGQIWKFAEPGRLKQITESAGEKEWKGTNLELIQRYFGALNRGQYDMVTFKTWINCNTISDYKSIRSRR